MKFQYQNFSCFRKINRLNVFVMKLKLQFITSLHFLINKITDLKESQFYFVSDVVLVVQFLCCLNPVYVFIV